MSVTSWAKSMADSSAVLLIKKNRLNSLLSWRRVASKGVSILCTCLLLGQMANAQNFRTLRDVKVNETVLDLSKTNCTVIPRNAMHSCHRLISLILPTKLDSIGSQAFFACDGIGGELSFSATTRVVEASAFNGCRQLTGLNFGGSTRIGAFAFANCRGLREVRLSAVLPPVCADNAFDGIDLSRVKLIVPTTSKRRLIVTHWAGVTSSAITKRRMYATQSTSSYLGL